MLAALIAGTVAAARANACEMCREDKIAATYDWSVAAAAEKRGHTVVFAAIEGRLNPHEPGLARAITRKLAAVPGVDAGTVRVSLAPPAASFACDPKRDAPARTIASMNRALASCRLSLALVQVGVPGAPAPPRAQR
jgi:hypothetical protein